MIVAVLVTRQDAEDPLANHLGKRVLDLVRPSAVLQAGDETRGQPDLVIELAER